MVGLKPPAACNAFSISRVYNRIMVGLKHKDLLIVEERYVVYNRIMVGLKLYNYVVVHKEIGGL